MGVGVGAGWCVVKSDLPTGFLRSRCIGWASSFFSPLWSVRACMVPTWSSLLFPRFFRFPRFFFSYEIIGRLGRHC